MLKLGLANRFSRRTLRSFLVAVRGADLAELGKLAAAGRLAPVIERRYRLEDAVEAMRHLAAGHAQGKTVLTVIEDADAG